MRTALLLVDVLDDFRHGNGEELAAAFRAAASRLERLIREARGRGLPVVYANDVAGRWSDGRDQVVERACTGLAGDATRRIAPEPDDVFVVKPRYSAFDHTPLRLILAAGDIERIVLAGTATEMCVAQTAIDAREVGLKVTVVPDACAAVDDAMAEIALQYLERVAGVFLEDGIPDDAEAG
ncbi:MAG TPA: isochorismatase family cysteine hydrolase [Gaiellales bacterium]|jgi:nicotinamidase-related amidase